MKQNWEYKKLGEVCESDLGKTLNQSKDTGNLQPYLCSVNIQWDGIDLTTIKQAKFEDDEIDRYSVKEGDLLICEGGDVGRAAIWKGKPMLYQNALHRVRFNESVIARFALLYLRHLKTIGDIDTKYSRGVTIKHLVKTSLNSIPIPVPPLSTQTAIVSELDALSAIIADHKSLLKKYDELEQSIFYHMFGDPVKNEKGWEVKTIGDVCRLKSGNSNANNSKFGDLPYIKVSDMNMKENEDAIVTSSTYVDREENGNGIFPVGTTIFPKRGGAILTNKKRITKVEICCDLNTMGVIPLNEVLPIYVYHFFRNLDLGSLCNGAAIPQLNNCDINPIRCCVPPISIQQSFASKIESIEQMKADTKKSLAKSEELFNARMDYYFNA